MNDDIYERATSPYASLDQIAAIDKPARHSNSQSFYSQATTSAGPLDDPFQSGPNSQASSTSSSSSDDTVETLTPPPTYSSRTPNARHSPKRHSPPSKILGKIDEDGGMAPDIPLRNPRRHHRDLTYLKTPSAFISALFPSASPKLAEKLTPHESEYDSVTGPRGEKLSDARQNRRSTEIQKQPSRLKRVGWRTWACIGLVLIMAVAITAIGLVVGLTRRKGHSNNNDNGADGDRLNGSWSVITTFPVGSYTLQPYLLNISSSCTPNSATWRCYPYQTYSASQSGSMTTLNWEIAGQNISGDAQYTISASSNPFALPFTNASITLVDSGSSDARWSFTTVLQKIVIPDASITSDGSSARCYYNSSVLAGELYTKKEPDLRTGSGNAMWWPHAVQIQQTATSKPDCWKTVDGVDTERVVLSGNGSGGDCSCVYADVSGS